MTPTYSIDQVAERYNMDRDQVVRRCRRKLNAWPHLRPNKRDASTWIFTDADLDAIDSILRETGPRVDSWGRIIRGGAA